MRSRPSAAWRPADSNPSRLRILVRRGSPAALHALLLAAIPSPKISPGRLLNLLNSTLLAGV